MSVGFLDSGIGGLTALSLCMSLFPEAEYIYIADTANAPYGVKDADFFAARAAALTDRLAERGACCAVMACNSCSTSTINQSFRLPVIRLLPPLKQALEATPGKVLLMGTPATVNSEYVNNAPSPRLIKLADSRLAALVEDAAPEFQSLKPYLKQRLTPYKGCGAVILGCTHYVYLEDLIKDILPGAEIIDGGKGVIGELTTLRPSGNGGGAEIIITGNSKNDYKEILSALLKRRGVTRPIAVKISYGL